MKERANCENARIAERLEIIAAKDNSVPTADDSRDARTCDSRAASFAFSREEDRAAARLLNLT